jgi:hypothetical protein
MLTATAEVALTVTARRRLDPSRSTGTRHELTSRGWVLVLTSAVSLVYPPGRQVVGQRSTKPIEAGRA